MLFGIHYKSNTRGTNKQFIDNKNAIYINGTIDIRFINPIEAIKTAKELQRRQNSKILYRVFKEEKGNEHLFGPDQIVKTMEEYFSKKQEQKQKLFRSIEIETSSMQN